MSTTTEQHQCGKRVYNSGGFHSHQCPRKATVQRGSFYFCKQHDPESVAARRAASHTKYEAEMNVKRARWRLECSAPDLLAALKDLLVAGRDPVCDTAHHNEWQQHGINEECPVEAAWIKASNAAEAAIAKAEGSAK